MLDKCAANNCKLTKTENEAEQILPSPKYVPHSDAKSYKVGWPKRIILSVLLLPYLIILSYLYCYRKAVEKLI